MLETLLTHGSLALMFAALVVAGFGVPIPEDIVLLSAGALVHRGVIALPATVAVCALGVLAGDLVLFTTARRLGARALERRAFQRLLPPERRKRVEALFVRHGGRIVFVARHVAGLRAPVFVMAGIHGMSVRRFLLWDALGLCVSAPIVIGLGCFLSEHIDRVHKDMARVEHWIGFTLVVAFLGYLVWVWLKRARSSPPAPEG